MASGVKYDRDSVFKELVVILKNMTSDWDVDVDEEIKPETRLIGDLGFESIDVVQLVVAIEERFQRRDLPVEELLMHEGRYVDELNAKQIVDFLTKHLTSA